MYLRLLVKTILRRPLRTCLTVSAVAIAICAVVALVGVSTGFKRSFTKLYEGMGIDVVVTRAGIRSTLTSTLDEGLGESIARVPNVKQVVAQLTDFVNLKTQGEFGIITYGWMPESAVFEHLKVTAGRRLRRGDDRCVMLGSMLAANLGKRPGDKLDILEERDVEVVGVFKSSTVFENGALVLPLATVQRLLDMPGKVSEFDVVVSDGTDRALVARVCRDIERMENGLSATPSGDLVQKLAEIRVAESMAWITSAIALVIGTVGTLNTMIMSVHERTREIGVLRAIGWRRSRVLRMVLGESILISLTGGVVGSVLAMLLLQLLTRLPAARGFLVREIDATTLLLGLGVAVLVGVLGGLLPALRASSVSPTRAIRTI